MRKVIVLFVIFVLAPVSIFAQEKVVKPIEVNISYGGPQAMLGWVGGAHTTFSAMLEVKYTPIKWVSIGLVGGLRDKSRGADLGPVEEGELEIGQIVGLIDQIKPVQEVVEEIMIEFKESTEKHLIF